jgi:hypothetical protein
MSGNKFSGNLYCITLPYIKSDTLDYHRDSRGVKCE